MSGVDLHPGTRRRKTADGWTGGTGPGQNVVCPLVHQAVETSLPCEALQAPAVEEHARLLCTGGLSQQMLLDIKTSWGSTLSAQKHQVGRVEGLCCWQSIHRSPVFGEATSAWLL